VPGETIQVGVDDSPAYAKLDKLDGKTADTGNRVKRVGNDFYVMEEKSKLSFRSVTSTIHQGYTLITQFMNVAGFSLDTVAQAMISSAFTMASSLYTMATTAASNPWTAATAFMTFMSAARMTGEAILERNRDALRKSKFERDKARITRRSISL